MSDPSPRTVKAIRDRDDWRCARCAGWGPLSTQHRAARGMGGTTWPGINRPANLLTLCGDGTRGCHGWVEAHPAWARDHGWSVFGHMRESAPLIPVWTWRGWVQLQVDGGLEELTDYAGVPDCECGCRAFTPDRTGWAAPTWGAAL